MLSRGHQSGDTLVEVLLSFAILSLVSVGTYTLMNRGMGESLAALESSQVRTGVNQQTELLTYFRDSYAAAQALQEPVNVYPHTVWAAVKTRAASNSSATPNAFDNCSAVMANSFYLSFDSAAGRYTVAPYSGAVPASLAVPGSGLWIEPVASSGVSIPYVDFYVKACWDPIASSEKRNISTVVRLYDKP